MIRREDETKQGRQTFPDLPQTNLERVAGYGAYDRNGEYLGKVNAIWTDQKGQPAFVGVRTSWLLGKTHIVPAYGASVNHQDEVIRLPYLEEDVKNAPNYDPDADLDSNREREVFAYYRTRGTHLPEREPSWRPEASTGRETPRATDRTAGETRSMPLHEEQIRAGTREVEAGGVRLRKVVRTETVQVPVDVKREDVVIERVPATGERRVSKDAFKNDELFIPLRREEAVAEKETRVREEVRARKTSTTQRQTVSGQVRKEDVEVEREHHHAE